jgi:hypothetical protein
VPNVHAPADEGIPIDRKLEDWIESLTPLCQAVMIAVAGFAWSLTALTWALEPGQHLRTTATIVNCNHNCNHL